MGGPTGNRPASPWGHLSATLTLRPQRRLARTETCRGLLESGVVQANHIPKYCCRCVWPKFWCGYVQTRQKGAHKKQARVKTVRLLDVDFQHPELWMCNRFFGIPWNWLRKWRYRLYLQQSSFQSEALFFKLVVGSANFALRGCLGCSLVVIVGLSCSFFPESLIKAEKAYSERDASQTTLWGCLVRLSNLLPASKHSLCLACLCDVPSAGPSVLRGRSLLSDAWVRELLWRRSTELDEEQQQRLARDILVLPVELLIRKCWSRYAPLMLRRRDSQWLASSDRRCILLPLMAMQNCTVEPVGSHLPEAQLRVAFSVRTNRFCFSFQPFLPLFRPGGSLRPSQQVFDPRLLGKTCWLRHPLSTTRGCPRCQLTTTIR